jgi:hypothetical protein
VKVNSGKIGARVKKTNIVIYDMVDDKEHMFEI